MNRLFGVLTVLAISLSVGAMNYALYATRISAGHSSGIANVTIGYSPWITTKWIVRPFADYIVGSLVAGVLALSVCLSLAGYEEPDPPEDGWSTLKMVAVGAVLAAIIGGAMYLSTPDPGEWQLVRSGTLDAYRTASDGRPVFVIDRHVHDFVGAELVDNPYESLGRDVELWFRGGNNTVKLEVVS